MSEPLLCASCDEPDLALLRRLRVQHENRIPDRRPRARTATTANRVCAPDLIDVVGLTALRDGLAAFAARATSARGKRLTAQRDLYVPVVVLDKVDLTGGVRSKLRLSQPSLLGSNALGLSGVVARGFIVGVVRLLVLVGCSDVPDSGVDEDMEDELPNDEDTAVLAALTAARAPRPERAWTFSEA